MLANRMVAPRLRWAGFVMVVTAVLLIAASRSVAAADGWVVRERPGTLEYRLPESPAWSPAALGATLAPGTAVRVVSGRPAILGENGTSILIRAGSELTLPPRDRETVVQRLGSVRYKIEPGTDQASWWRRPTS